MKNIIKYLEQHLGESLPFVLYAKPNSNNLIGFFQQDYSIHQTTDFLDRGFVFAPFDAGQQVFFPEHACEIIKDTLDFEVAAGQFEDFVPTQTVKEAHEALVQRGIDAIKAGTFHKVVLSRREDIPVADLNFLAMYQRLLQTYPTAFRYCFFHPQIGLWMGATPEQLLKKDGQHIATVSLAGTQVDQGFTPTVWGTKEQEEQQIVTDFITNALDAHCTQVQATAPHTAKAGSLLHLKSEIQGVLKTPEDFVAVLKALHPTPALCGLPKAAARDFINAEEGYPREYYAGFLGELNRNYENQEPETADLFVNLRCVQLKYNAVQLYLGGGITADSNPTAEFWETVNKSQTIKKIL